ncbi:peptidoglycan synthetase [Sandaracinomonas limnophila]|uniref:Peptidoglycan synthetase n=1 Tax=Sandaracinomonas limnophila TaxID=1862386 RepID=A0A437PTT4_9BACT|nr:Mur ligase family protein [Sandaracinomonas limnophila]RVU25671.1 peptidoglycan synthetase [Sandaracinomonas limnophila]
MLKIHFIAIGGAAMHNLALALQKNGHQITGSDDEIYEPSKSLLQKNGLLPDSEGWHPEKISKDLDVVILGMHARADNPELLKAQELGLRIESYPSFLYEYSKNKQRIVIAGSHGKTSITSMILHVLKKLNRKFDYLVGARIEGFELMAQLSDAPIIIIEGDEYLASPLDRRAKFLLYQPHIALVSGIAWDHMNVYPTFESYQESFKELIKNLPKAGTLIYDETDPILKEMPKLSQDDVIKKPYKEHPALIENGKTILKGDDGVKYPITVFGNHNLKNINGARLICEQIGIEATEFYQAIQDFKGAAKRLEIVKDNGKSIVFKDFAHAPSKVKATTEAVKQQFPERKLVACLELHTFSSLNPAFLPQYEGTLNLADEAIIFLSEHARAIKRMDKIEEETVQNYFKHSKLTVIRDREELEKDLISKDWSNANLLMMSSGTFDGISFQEL